MLDAGDREAQGDRGDRRSSGAGRPLVEWPMTRQPGDSRLDPAVRLRGLAFVEVLKRVG
jgi:hypothetical protein